MEKKVIKIKGLDCANCARELEEELNEKIGVKASVDFINQQVKLEFNTKDELEKAKYAINHFEDVQIVEDLQKVTLKIEGLDCANCARELEEVLEKIDGIKATVDFINQQVKLEYNSIIALEKAKFTINHFEEVKIVEDKKKQTKFEEHKKDIICLIVSLVLLVPAIIISKLLDSTASMIISYIMYVASYIIVGHEVLINTVKNLSKGKVFDENFLMTVASIGAIVLGFINNGDGLFEGVMVMFLYQLGELLQSLAVGKSRESITKLMDLKSEEAILIKDGEQIIVSPDQLKVGDKILVKVGEKVPVDGIVKNGSSSFDYKSLNGEAIPKELNIGDEVLSGAINLSQAIEIEVIREYKDSTVAKILDMVENSTEKKAKSEKFITKFAKYYTPSVVIAALIVASIVPTIIGAINGVFNWGLYSTWIYNALCFLVISCPCALVISVPLAYFSGIGKSARYGVLIKGSTALDELANSTLVAFDKTGTLTYGEFKVQKYSNDEALKIAKALEEFSSHPIAKAFNGIKSEYVAKDVKEISGKGLEGIIDKSNVLCGNATLLKEKGIAFEEIDSIATILYVAKDNNFVGVIEIDDVIKEGAKEAIEALRKEGVNHITMLSGDNKKRAKAIAEELALDGFEGALLPDQKLEKANALKKKGGLIYVGDGINDAPVMVSANCAISMGSIGSDAAIEASDIVLISDELSLIAKAKNIAKKTRRIVIENIAGSLVVKFGIMVLDLIWGLIVPGGVFPLIVSVVADVGVMLLAVLNSMRIMFKK